jgi:hypothetical protein
MMPPAMAAAFVVIVSFAPAIVEPPVTPAALEAFFVPGFMAAIYSALHPATRSVVVVMLNARASTVAVAVVCSCWHCRAGEKQKPRCQNRCLHVHCSFDVDPCKLANTKLSGAMLDARKLIVGDEWLRSHLFMCGSSFSKAREHNGKTHFTSRANRANFHSSSTNERR